MFDPLAYDAARVRHRELERVVNRPARLMGEELRFSNRARRRRPGRRRG
jgi:hypothetical protein